MFSSSMNVVENFFSFLGIHFHDKIESSIFYFHEKNKIKTYSIFFKKNYRGFLLLHGIFICGVAEQV